MPGKPMIELGFDQQQVSKEVTKVGQTIEKVILKSLDDISNDFSKILQEDLGKDFKEVIGGQNFRQSFVKGMVDVVKDTKFKNASKNCGDALAGVISDRLRTQIDPKSIEKVFTKSLKDADRAVERAAPEGLIDKAIYGKEGKQKKERSIARSVGAIVFQQTMSQFGRAGAIAGAAPGMMQSLGMAGGAAATAGMAGAALLGSTISFGRGREEAMLGLAPLMGRPNALGQWTAGSGTRGAAGAIAAGRGAMFSPQEAAAIAAPAARRGVGGAAPTIFRAQRAFGMGGDITELLGAMVSRGERVTKDTQARTEFQKIFTIGIRTGLEQGRWGEVARGMAQLISSRGIGMRADTSMLARMFMSMGRPGGFRGAEAAEAIKGLESMMTAPKTAVGRAIALQTAGLGRHGDIFKAERQMELGIFGQMEMPGGKTRRGVGVEGLRGMIGQYQQTYGLAGRKIGEALPEGGEAEIRRGALIKELATNMGLTQNATEKLLASIEAKNVSDRELKAIIEKGKPLEEQAYKAMIGLATYKGIETRIQGILDHLANGILPSVELIAKGIDKIADGVDYLASFFGRGAAVAQARTVGTMGAEVATEVFKEDPKFAKLAASKELAEIEETMRYVSPEHQEAYETRKLALQEYMKSGKVTAARESMSPEAFSAFLGDLTTTMGAMAHSMNTSASVLKDLSGGIAFDVSPSLQGNTTIRNKQAVAKQGGGSMPKAAHGAP